MTYSTIVADPPWDVAAGRSIGRYDLREDGSQAFGVTDNAARPLAYQSMSVDAIKALQVPAAEDAGVSGARLRLLRSASAGGAMALQARRTSDRDKRLRCRLRKVREEPRIHRNLA